MAIGQSIEAVDAKFLAVEAALKAAMSKRKYKDSLQHFDAHEAADLKKGVVMMTSGGEGKYSDRFGKTAREGWQRLVVVFQFQVEETDAPRAVLLAELAFIEELKSFAKAGVANMTLRLEKSEQSRQLEHPYGWVVAYLEAGPNATNLG